MSYAVVLNPPKKHSGRVAFTNKMRELGRLYRQSKAGNVPRWQEFVKKAISGAKFNSPASAIGSMGVSGASTYITLHLLEKSARKKAFKEYLVNEKYADKPKEAIENYYNTQMGANAIKGSLVTAAQWGVAKLAQKTSIGKYVSPWAVAVGGVVATGVKVGERFYDLKKCKDYPVLAVIEKEAKKYAANDAAYFGDEYKTAIETILKSSGNYSNTQQNNQSSQTDQQQDQIEETEESDVVQGITYDEYSHVGGPVYYHG